MWRVAKAQDTVSAIGVVEDGVEGSFVSRLGV